MARCLEALTTKCVHVHAAKEVGTCNLGPILDSLGSSLSRRESTVRWTENDIKHLNVDFMFESSPWLQSEGETSFLMRALLKEIDLLSLSGSYESAPSHSVVLPFTGAAHWQADDDSQAAPRCVYVRACLLHIAECVRARVSPRGLKTEICQWLHRLSA